MSKKHLVVKENIYWVGALNKDLRVFDIIMYTPYGTSYNAYIVRGKDKVALIETVKDRFLPELEERIDSIGDIKKIDYIVLNHTEPDHSGAAYNFYKDRCPDATIVGTETTLRFLKKIANKDDFKSIAVKEGMSIDLGGMTLQFIMAPFLHWPDSMFTYIPENKTLFTCDSFGAHYSYDEVFNDVIKAEADFIDAYKYYFDCIMGPFTNFVNQALKKIENIEIETICTGHGAVLRKDIPRYINLYKEWANKPKPKNKVVIAYVSAYGYTKTMGERIADGLKKGGIDDIKMFDMVTSKKDDVIKEIDDARGILLGSPTLVGDALPPIYDIATSLNPIIHTGRIAGVFGSYGWSGEATGFIEERLKQLRFKLPLDKLKINFKPSSEEEKLCVEFGVNFANAMLGKEIDPKFVSSAAKPQLNNPVKDSSKIRYWKCVVCGEIFEGEEAPEKCPACGAGRDMFEEYFKKEGDSASKFKGKVVIVGGGAAGVYAAKTIREGSKDAEITIIEGEEYLPYYRPMVSTFLSDNKIVEHDNFYIKKKEWYKENNIELLLKKKVASIDTKNKLVKTDKDEFKYDKLILANGSSSFIPFADVDKEGIFTIKYLSDAKNAYNYSKNCSSVIIIGGGVLGLEIAHEFLKLGLTVNIIEFQNRILPIQLDNYGSDILQNIMQDKKINLLLGKSVETILGDKTVTGVKLTSGEIIESPMIILSTGVRANINIAKDAGIECNKGVIVNEKMETSRKDIYACGDITEFQNKTYPVWINAINQGVAAGNTILGNDSTYVYENMPTMLEAFGAKIYSVGNIKEVIDNNYPSLTFTDSKNFIYKRFYFKDGILVAGILINDIKQGLFLTNGINSKIGFDKVASIING